MKNIVFLIASLTATPGFALEECLLGAWQVDADALAQVLAGQLNASAAYVDGDAFMEIGEDGAVRMLVSNIVMKVQMAGAPEMDVTINGNSRGNITAEGGLWTIVGGEYTLVGSAFVMGQSMSIPFSSETGMFGGGSGSYICGDDRLTFASDNTTAQMPSQWVRLP